MYTKCRPLTANLYILLIKDFGPERNPVQDAM